MSSDCLPAKAGFASGAFSNNALVNMGMIIYPLPLELIGPPLWVTVPLIFISLLMQVVSASTTNPAVLNVTLYVTSNTIDLMP